MTSLTDVNVVLFCELQQARPERVLRTSVDVAASFENARHCEHGGGGHLALVVSNRLQQVVGCVVQTHAHVAEPVRAT